MSTAAAQPPRPAARPLIAGLCEWAAPLRYEDLPERIAALAKSQLLSQLAAIRAGAADPRGRALMQAFGPGGDADPRRTARLLGGLGSWLNLDDTAYAGHLSNSTAGVPLAYATAAGLDGRALLTAVVAANECAARITAAATLGPLRGQTALHTSLVGAVAGRMHALGRPGDRWTAAMSLALSLPPWPLMHAYLGTDARVLAAALPIGTAMDACDAAEAGLSGPPDLLEHPHGFLSKFADVPLPESVLDGLGARWHTDTLSFKVRPCGPGVDAAVDCAVELHHEFGAPDPAQVAEIVVDVGAYTQQVQKATLPYELGPTTPPSVLPLSVPYTVATALLTGNLAVADYASPRVADPGRWRLAEKVTVHQDPAMTRELVIGEAPYGHALRLAGVRAREWITALVGPGLLELLDDPPMPDFAASTKRTAARVSVRLADGRRLDRERVIPVGAAGPDTRERHAELVEEKFVANGGSAKLAQGWLTVEEAGPQDLAELLELSLADLGAPVSDL